MSIIDYLLIICIVGAAGGLLYRSLRKQLTCSGCAGCSCGHKKPVVEIDGLKKQ